MGFWDVFWMAVAIGAGIAAADWVWGRIEKKINEAKARREGKSGEDNRSSA